MVVDANTGAVLHNRAGDEKVYPASLTKMMTLYMTFELIELGRLDYDSKIKMTQEGADAAPSKLDLEPGEELTVLNAIKALVTKSANDVAIALAMHIGGTETNFARLMTSKAREHRHAEHHLPQCLGPARSRADDDGARHDHPRVAPAGRLPAPLPAVLHAQLHLRRQELPQPQYAAGPLSAAPTASRPGYTRASGFNLVTSVRRDGKHVVAAVFGGDTARERNAKMQSLLNARACQGVDARSRASRRSSPARRSRRVPQAPGRVAEAAAARRSRHRQPAAAAAVGARARYRDRRRQSARRAHRQRAARRARRTHRAAPSAAQPVFAVAGAGGAMPPPRAPQRASQAFPRFVPETGALQPSTLQAQAAQLEGRQRSRRRRAPSPRWRRKHPAPPAARSRGSRGPFEIQIGAFGNSAEAERRMAAARERAGGMLDRLSRRRHAGAERASKLYRARFRGFDATAANAHLLALRSLQIDCFVIKTE